MSPSLSRAYNTLCNSTVDPGPHAVTSLTTASGTTQYCYDASGNQLLERADASNWRSVAYTMADQAKEIRTQVQGGVGSVLKFDYGAGRERIRRLDFSSLTASTPASVTHYVGGAEIIRSAAPAGCAVGDTKVRREYAGMVLTQQRKIADSGCTATDTTTRVYRFTDHLGSTDALVDSAGNAVGDGSGQVVSQQRFDAFGMRRVASNWSAFTAPLPYTFDTQITRKGYTGHEQLDQSGLIHMNGRVYDPRLGRFIQADPIVQAPYDAQSLNRYSYVFNNPLANTDPTGYLSHAQRSFFQTIGTAAAVAFTAYMGPIIGQTATGVTATSCVPANVPLAAAMATGTGFVAGALSTGTLKGGLQGAFQGGVTFGIGQAFTAANAAWAYSGGEMTAAGHAVKALAHGTLGGVVANLQGGDFGHGFAAAGITESMSPLIESSGSSGVLVSALVGGTASRLVGGKFANGALTAAMVWGLNHDPHDYRDLEGGYKNRQDNIPDTDLYEIHVYKDSKKFRKAFANNWPLDDYEVGVLGADGQWLPKHKWKEAPNLRTSTAAALRQRIAVNGQRRNWLNGTEDLTGEKLTVEIRAGMARTGSLKWLNAAAKGLGTVGTINLYIDNLSDKAGCAQAPTGSALAAELCLY